MRFRGGGVGHVATRIEDPEEPEGSMQEQGEDTETVIPIPVAAEGGDNEEEDSEFWDEIENGGGSDDSGEEDEPNEEEEEEEEETRNGEDEQDDVEGLGAEQIQKRLREVILDDLGYSEM